MLGAKRLDDERVRVIDEPGTSGEGQGGVFQVEGAEIECPARSDGRELTIAHFIDAALVDESTGGERWDRGHGTKLLALDVHGAGFIGLVRESACEVRRRSAKPIGKNQFPRHAYRLWAAAGGLGTKFGKWTIIRRYVYKGVTFPYAVRGDL